MLSVKVVVETESFIRQHTQKTQIAISSVKIYFHILEIALAKIVKGGLPLASQARKLKAKFIASCTHDTNLSRERHTPPRASYNHKSRSRIVTRVGELAEWLKAAVC